MKGSYIMDGRKKSSVCLVDTHSFSPFAVCNTEQLIEMIMDMHVCAMKLKIKKPRTRLIKKAYMKCNAFIRTCKALRSDIHGKHRDK